MSNQPASTGAAARPPRPPRAGWPRTGLGILTGLLTAAAALGVAQLVAGITKPEGSPVVAVGRAVIDVTPRPVTDFAIRVFGPHDKQALLAAIVVILAVFAAGFGVATMRSLRAGLGGLAVFAAVGMLAVVTRPDFTAVEVTPALAGVAAGAVALIGLARAAGTGRARGRAAGSTAPGTGQAPGQARSAAPSADRRSFLATGAAAAGVAAAGGGVGMLLSERSAATTSRAQVRIPAPSTPAPPLPAGNDLRIPGLSPFETPSGSFYRVDTALLIPQVPANSWRLRVHGMVDRELRLTFDDLIRRPLTEADITLCCVSNPVGGPYISNARWVGVVLAGVLREAGVRAGADQLLSTSTDGYTSGTPIAAVLDGRNALLAVAMNGAALPTAHGFPARMIVPGLYGYVSATKWVTDIKVTTFAHEQGYWVQQGWAVLGPVKTQSRIDVPDGGKTLRAGRVTVAGVAWAQHRGVAAVEVRVDGGAWQQARLASVPGIDTWRQWAWDWDATPGSHQLQVRATDETGYTQTGQAADPYPDGATGWHDVQVSVIA